MEKRYGKKWNRDETILACELYCRTPFSKISKENKEIVELAKLLNRSVGAVVFKMANIAHFDPIIIQRGRKGLSNASHLDQEVFDEFANDWQKLSYEAQQILAKYKGIEVEQLNTEYVVDIIPPGEDRIRATKVRVGQYFFRASVLASYGYKCCITGIKTPDLLIASHIKPWSVSDEKTERTNPSNGLCLNALHDRAFDKGLITIDNHYHLIVSKELKNVKMDEKTRLWFDSYDNTVISLPDKFRPKKEFIEYHNDMVFLG